MNFHRNIRLNKIKLDLKLDENLRSNYYYFIVIERPKAVFCIFTKILINLAHLNIFNLTCDLSGYN